MQWESYRCIVDVCSASHLDILIDPVCTILMVISFDCHSISWLLLPSYMFSFNWYGISDLCSTRVHNR